MAMSTMAMPTRLSLAAMTIAFAAAGIACGTVSGGGLPVAERHRRGEWALAARVVTLEQKSAKGFLELELLNCGNWPKGIYWPAPGSSASWVLESASLSGGRSGGRCTTSLIRGDAPIVIAPGQKWTLLCPISAVPQDRSYRLDVEVNVDSPNGFVAVRAVIGEQRERVPVCEDEDVGGQKQEDSGRE